MTVVCRVQSGEEGEKLQTDEERWQLQHSIATKEFQRQPCHDLSRHSVSQTCVSSVPVG